MAWIKRNLFFVIGGVVSVALLGVAAVYDFKSYSHNSDAFGRLNEIYGTLQGLAQQKPSPGNSRVDNIKAARDQEKQIREWVDQTGKYFQPMAAIPDSPEVTSEAFAAALRKTIDQLQHEADTANVTLPPKYGFSFEAQRSLVKFAPGSLPPLAAQLGEVKTISEILFAARINSLDSVQRVRVSDDDAAGPQADYLDDHPAVDEMAVVTPYAITFRAFSAEIAQVLAGFASSPHGFIVKGINVAPAGSAAASGSQETSAPSPAMPVPAKGGLPTVLNEQLLRVTLEIEIVKPQPKK
jgi:hypothetical protein